MILTAAVDRERSSALVVERIIDCCRVAF